MVEIMERLGSCANKRGMLITMSANLHSHQPMGQKNHFTKCRSLGYGELSSIKRIFSSIAV